MASLCTSLFQDSYDLKHSTSKSEVTILPCCPSNSFQLYAWHFHPQVAKVRMLLIYSLLPHIFFPKYQIYLHTSPVLPHLFLTETSIVVSQVLSLTSLLLLSINHHSIFRTVFLNSKPHHVTTLLSSHSLSVFIRALSNWVIIPRGRRLKCFLKYLKLETLSGFIDILKWIDEKILEHE